MMDMKEQSYTILTRSLIFILIFIFLLYVKIKSFQFPFRARKLNNSYP